MLACEELFTVSGWVLSLTVGGVMPKFCPAMAIVVHGQCEGKKREISKVFETSHGKIRRR
jgi:hypothetical protein